MSDEARDGARDTARDSAARAAEDARRAAEQEAAETGAPTQSEMQVAFTPKQLFTGFAILAGLILLARRRGGRREAGRIAHHGMDDDAKKG